MNKRLLLLAAIAAGLTVLAVTDDRLPLSLSKIEPIVVSPEAVVPDAPPGTPRTIGNPLSGLSTTDFGDIAGRPLFNPSRAPAPPPALDQPPDEPTPIAEAPPPAEETINPADFTPLAIATSDSGSTAVIRWNPTGEVFRLKPGQSLQGFEVAAIGYRDVTISRDGQSVVLKLFQQLARPPRPDSVDSEASGEDMDPTTPGLGGETSMTARPPPDLIPPQGLLTTED